MIEIVRITDCSTQEYQFTEELLTASFPEEEYRELAMLRKYVEKEKYFYYHIILHNEEPIGLVSFWQLSNYYYVEHLAVHTNKRGKNYGGLILSLLKERLQQIILEVELPNDETSMKRIKFYQRNGFHLLDYDYQQPPYRKGGRWIPMRLMTNCVSSSEQIPQIVKEIHQKAYHCIK